MRKSAHELNRIPTEFHEDGAPEFFDLPDEFNRFPKQRKRQEKRSSLRKILLILAFIGILAIPGLAPMHPVQSPAETETALPQKPTHSLTSEPEGSDSISKSVDAATPKPVSNPIPDCTVIYYQTHSVSHGVILLTDPAHTTAVHVRLFDEQVQASAFEYDFTEADIALGKREFLGIDLNDFYVEHRNAYEELGAYAHPYLQVVLTYRTVDGEEGTVEHHTYAQPEEWVSVSYHQDGEEAADWYFPGCFVASVYDTANDSLVFTSDAGHTLEPGEICVTVTVGGESIPSELCRVHRLSETYEYDGETFTRYAYFFAMRRPENFPSKGTAQVTVRERLLHFDYVLENTYTIDYDAAF